MIPYSCCNKFVLCSSVSVSMPPFLLSAFWFLCFSSNMICLCCSLINFTAVFTQLSAFFAGPLFVRCCCNDLPFSMSFHYFCFCIWWKKVEAKQAPRLGRARMISVAIPAVLVPVPSAIHSTTFLKKCEKRTFLFFKLKLSHEGILGWLWMN